MENQDIGVYHKTIQSGKWFLMDVFGQKLINLLTFLVLARLLNPRDYGVIGVVLLIHGFFDQLTNPSFGQALTREKETIEQYLDSYWTFEILRYFFIAVILFFSAGTIGTFFHFETLEISLLRWSGLLMFVTAFGNVRQIYFFKNLRFDKIFLRDMVTQTSFACAAIAYAFFVQASVWAIFAGYFFSYFIGVVLTYILYPSRPAFAFHFGRLRKLVSYSKWVYGQNLLEVVLAQFDKLVVGRLLDPASLGLYSKGKDLASTTTAIMSSLIAKVGFSAFAKLQDQIVKVRRGFLQSIDVLLLSGLPVTLLLLLEGGTIVSLLLGPKWLGMVVSLKIFAFGNLFLAFVRVVNPVLAALGRPDVNFKTNAIQTIISVPCMYLGFIFYGLNGLAGALVLTWIFLLFYVMSKARPVLNIPVRAFFPAIASGSLSSFCVLLIDMLGRAFIHSYAIPLLDVAWIGSLGLLYFVCMYFISSRFSGGGPWETLASIFKSLVSRKSVGLP